MLVLLGLPAIGCSQVISGKVVEDGSDNPVPRARVRVLPEGASRTVLNTETDGSGAFHTPRLAPGTYHIEVSISNYVGTQVQVPLAPEGSRQGDQGVLIHLVRGGVISGTVRDEVGRELPGARVVPLIRVPGNVAPQPFNAGTKVDDRGRYRLTGLPPGLYAVALLYSGASTGMTLYPGGGVEQARWLSINGGDERSGVDFNVLPLPSYTVEGTVRLQDGAAAAGFAVSAVSPLMPSSALVSQITDNSGRFSFRALASGSYYINAAGPVVARAGSGALLGSKPMFGRVSIGDLVLEQETTVQVKAGETLKLTLRVEGTSSDRSCAESATTTLRSLDSWGTPPDRRAVLRIGEASEVADLPPGRYAVTAASLLGRCILKSVEYDGTASSDGVIDLSAGSTREIAVVLAENTSVLRGRIEATGTELSGTAVILLNVYTRETDPAGPIRVIFPSPDGRYEFRQLPPGLYRLGTASVAADHPGGRWISDVAAMQEITLVPGGQTEVNLKPPVR